MGRHWLRLKNAPKQQCSGGNRTASLRALVCMVTSQVNWNADDGRRRNQITSFPRADGLCRIQRSFEDDYINPGVARTFSRFLTDAVDRWTGSFLVRNS